MNYLLGSSQVLAGLAVLVAWWLALFFMGRRNKAKTTLTSMGFAVWPTVFLLWFVGGCILILRSLGVV